MKSFLAAAIISILILPSASAVVISEILYDPDGTDTGNEFVELYNPASTPVNLTGWVVEMGNGNDGKWKVWAPLEGSVPAYGYYLIGQRNIFSRDCPAVGADLQNSPDSVRLKDPSKIIDTVGYGEKAGFNNPGMYEASPAADVKSGHSLERKPGFLIPWGGNNQDTGNNSADFLEREKPEPQNSKYREAQAQKILDAKRILSPLKTSYKPNVVVNVSLSYSFLTSQIGLVVRETNPMGIIQIMGSDSADAENSVWAESTEATDSSFDESTHVKWLMGDRFPLKDGTINYIFTTPPEAGSHKITGEWKTVDNDGVIYYGSFGETIIEVIGGPLSGFIENIFGNPMEKANVTLVNKTVVTNQSGRYEINATGNGNQTINASKSGYLVESAIINVTKRLVFDFVNDYSLVPEELNDGEVLTAIFRWSKNRFGDNKILEVIHQWANTQD